MPRTLSVIVPLYNEEENLAPLHEGLTMQLESLDLPFEIVLVDDGSTDRTAAEAIYLAQLDARVRVVKLRRNCGQTAAMAAGIEQARGELIVTMDGDLQNDPADIGRLLQEIQAGNDIVVGWRHNRQDLLLSRKLPSRIANWLISRVIGMPIQDIGCPLKAYRASVIKEIPLYAEMHRFIPAMAGITGARIAQIKVNHYPRIHGRSKYGLSRTYKVLLDLLVIKTLTSFNSRPLRWFAWLAAPLLTLSALAFARAFYIIVAQGRPLSLPLAGSGVIFFVAAFFMLLSGALGELVFKVGDVREHRFSRLTQHVQ